MRYLLIMVLMVLVGCFTDSEKSEKGGEGVAALEIIEHVVGDSTTKRIVTRKTQNILSHDSIAESFTLQDPGFACHYNKESEMYEWQENTVYEERYSLGESYLSFEGSKYTTSGALFGSWEDNEYSVDGISVSLSIESDRIVTDLGHDPGCSAEEWAAAPRSEAVDCHTLKINLEDGEVYKRTTYLSDKLTWVYIESFKGIICDQSYGSHYTKESCEQSSESYNQENEACDLFYKELSFYKSKRWANCPISVLEDGKCQSYCFNLDDAVDCANKD